MCLDITNKCLLLSATNQANNKHIWISKKTTTPSNPTLCLDSNRNSNRRKHWDACVHHVELATILGRTITAMLVDCYIRAKFYLPAFLKRGPSLFSRLSSREGQVYSPSFPRESWKLSTTPYTFEKKLAICQTNKRSNPPRTAPDLSVWLQRAFWGRLLQLDVDSRVSRVQM